MRSGATQPDHGFSGQDRAGRLAAEERAHQEKILDESKMKRLPEHGSCFVCGTQNPHSIGLTWYQDEDGSIVAEMIFCEAHQGPPGHVHGGASAAVLDEAMGAVVWRAGYSVVSVNLEIN